MLAVPIQTRSISASEDSGRAHRVEVRVHAGGDHVDAFDPGPRSEGAIGEEIITGDDRVRQLDRPGETPEAAATLRPARIVRIAVQDGIVEIEDEVPRGPAQNAELPGWQEFTLQDHGVEPVGAAELQSPRERPLVEPFTRKGPTRFLEVPGQRPGSGIGSRRGRESRPVRVNSSRPP